ncbi:hypothetical protein J3458_001402 [Metarhizium acridum]|uniref:uncharacterized protein n=1 Tax=Metarhizium acridum TaxID=92637 RepID=UPI001C6AF1FD|nr:hypothetical protein J3458_001402 [Metarhizium acridum]
MSHIKGHHSSHVVLDLKRRAWLFPVTPATPRNRFTSPNYGLGAVTRIAIELRLIATRNGRVERFVLNDGFLAFGALGRPTADDAHFEKVVQRLVRRFLVESSREEWWRWTLAREESSSGLWGVLI